MTPSRAFIRTLAGDDELAVASPTFMLQLIYDDFDGPCVHPFPRPCLGSMRHAPRCVSRDLQTDANPAWRGLKHT